MALAEDKEVKRTSILKAAALQFNKYGIAKTSLHDIAASVGLTTQSLYYYFEDKAAIIVAVVLSVVDTYLGEVATAVSAAGNATGVMEASTHAWLAVHKKYPMLKLAAETFSQAATNIPALRDAMLQMANKEAALLEQYMVPALGIAPNKALNNDIQLFLAARAGLTKLMLYNNFHGLVPEEKAFTELENALVAFGEIYMGGLKFKYNTEQKL